MASRIQLIIEAEDRASGVLKSINTQFSSIGSTLKAVAGAAIAYGVFDKVAEQIMGAVNATVAYTDEVRNLAQISGQGTEETGRMLQVLDDFGLTAADATIAVRTLTKAGLAPTIDTLADLADEYNSLSTVQKKNEFIMKNLGKAGLQWATMLSKGGKAIKDMAADVNGVLAPTEAAVKAAEDYKFALDAWEDKTNELKQTIGMALIPTLTDLLDITTNLGEASEQTQNSEEYLKLSLWERAKATIEAALAMGDEEAAARSAADAVKAMGDAEGDAVGQSKELADAMKELSRANQTLLSNMFSIQNASEDFAEGEQKRAEQLKEIEAEKMKIALEQHVLWGAEEIINRKLNKHHGDRVNLLRQSAGNMADLNELTMKQLELDAEYNEVLQEGVQAQQDKKDATNKMVYSMLEQRAAQDGITSDEVTFLQNTAVNMGLVDRASADAAISAANWAEELWQGFQATDQAMTTVKTHMELVNDQMDKLAEHNGQVVRMTAILDVVSTLNQSGFQRYGGLGGYAEGGMVGAGRPIIVGEEGPEMFIPRQSGEIIPNDRLNQSVTININGTFRIPQDMDYVAQEVAKIMAR